MDTGLSVCLPGDIKKSKTTRVLYLLHPLGGNSQSWMRWTSAERYSSSHNLAVIMPEVQRSFYIDMAKGGRYFSYLTSELPRLVSELFGLHPSREDTFICGASMGGYGALKAALTLPDNYAACACFSGAYDLEMVKAMALPIPGSYSEIAAVLGDRLEVGDENNLIFLARQSASAKYKPGIFICCGDSDLLLPASIRMRGELEALGFEVCYRQWPGGHDWSFWDEALEMGCAFFDGTEPPKKPHFK